jgi:hypothetical protein
VVTIEDSTNAAVSTDTAQISLHITPRASEPGLLQIRHDPPNPGNPGRG